MDGETFSTVHMAATGVITGAIVFCVAIGLLRRTEGAVTLLAFLVLSGTAVFLFRQSANLPQLNADGMSWFSANDWLAPLVVYAVLSCYFALVPPKQPAAVARTTAVATFVALVVNVVTI